METKPVTSCPYYANGESLRAKHQQVRFESGRIFENWALKLVPLHATSTILDAGCGWGRFTWPLIEAHGVAPFNLVCMDRSPGMVQTAVQEAQSRGHAPLFTTGDIEALPFAANQFDGVMANHVLYHMSDLAQGVYELARVVKPNGWLLATTNSDAIRVPIIELHYRALEHLGINYEIEAASPFSMETGAAILQTRFQQVDSFYFEDETIYPDANAFMQVYVTIGRYRNLLARADIDAECKKRLPGLVQELAQDIVQREGRLRSPARMGAFVCTNPIKN